MVKWKNTEFIKEFHQIHITTLHVDLYVGNNGYEESSNELINFLWQLEREDGE